MPAALLDVPVAVPFLAQSQLDGNTAASTQLGKDIRRTYALATGSSLGNVIINSTIDALTRDVVYYGRDHPINAAVDLPSPDPWDAIDQAAALNSVRRLQAMMGGMSQEEADKAFGPAMAARASPGLLHGRGSRSTLGSFVRTEFDQRAAVRWYERRAMGMSVEERQAEEEARARVLQGQPGTILNVRIVVPPVSGVTDTVGDGEVLIRQQAATMASMTAALTTLNTDTSPGSLFSQLADTLSQSTGQPASQMRPVVDTANIVQVTPAPRFVMVSPSPAPLVPDGAIAGGAIAAGVFAIALLAATTFFTLRSRAKRIARAHEKAKAMAAAALASVQEPMSTQEVPLEVEPHAQPAQAQAKPRVTVEEARSREGRQAARMAEINRGLKEHRRRRKDVARAKVALPVQRRVARAVAAQALHMPRKLAKQTAKVMRAEEDTRDRLMNGRVKGSMKQANALARRKSYPTVEGEDNTQAQAEPQLPAVDTSLWPTTFAIGIGRGSTAAKYRGSAADSLLAEAGVVHVSTRDRRLLERDLQVQLLARLWRRESPGQQDMDKLGRALEPAQSPSRVSPLKRNKTMEEEGPGSSPFDRRPVPQRAWASAEGPSMGRSASAASDGVPPRLSFTDGHRGGDESAYYEERARHGGANVADLPSPALSVTLVDVGTPRPAGQGTGFGTRVKDATAQLSPDINVTAVITVQEDGSQDLPATSEMVRMSGSPSPSPRKVDAGRHMPAMPALPPMTGARPGPAGSPALVSALRHMPTTTPVNVPGALSPGSSSAGSSTNGTPALPLRYVDPTRPRRASGRAEASPPAALASMPPESPAMIGRAVLFGTEGELPARPSHSPPSDMIPAHRHTRVYTFTTMTSPQAQAGAGQGEDAMRPAAMRRLPGLPAPGQQPEAVMLRLRQHAGQYEQEASGRDSGRSWREARDEELRRIYAPYANREAGRRPSSGGRYGTTSRASATSGTSGGAYDYFQEASRRHSRAGRSDRHAEEGHANSRPGRGGHIMSPPRSRSAARSGASREDGPPSGRTSRGPYDVPLSSLLSLNAPSNPASRPGSRPASRASSVGRPSSRGQGQAIPHASDRSYEDSYARLMSYAMGGRVERGAQGHAEGRSPGGLEHTGVSESPDRASPTGGMRLDRRAVSELVSPSPTPSHTRPPAHNSGPRYGGRESIERDGHQDGSPGLRVSRR